MRHSRMEALAIPLRQIHKSILTSSGLDTLRISLQSSKSQKIKDFPLPAAAAVNSLSSNFYTTAKMSHSDFTVLSDHNVKTLFTNFDKGDVSRMAEELRSAFLSYSTGKESKYQVHRQAVTRPNGQTTLFMPATLPGGVSVKIVGVPPPQPPQSRDASKVPHLRGVLLLCDGKGKSVGVINAEEFTAFRTSLGSMLLYQSRQRTENIVLFGAGKQAIWHLRLALVLRGPDIKSVTIVNRSASRAQQLIDRLHRMDHEAQSKVAAHVAFSIVESANSSFKDYQERLFGAVTDADVIFCTTPSTKPVFPSSWLTSEESRKKKRYLSAIGSYKLDMQEIDPELLRAVATTNLGTYTPDNNAATSGGIITVDSREACALEAGELVNAHLAPEKLLEVGELVNIQRTGDQKSIERLNAWLKDGFVIYKSVGVGIMDLALGNILLDLAREQNVGYRQEDF